MFLLAVKCVLAMFKGGSKWAMQGLCIILQCKHVSFFLF